MSMQRSFEALLEKQRRVELKSVGNFVAKTVLVESANQFSLEELCRRQLKLEIFFRSHVDHQTYGKTLTEVLLDIYRNIFLKFRVIDGEYIVKISRGIIKHVYEVMTFRFLNVRHKVPLITI